MARIEILNPAEHGDLRVDMSRTVARHHMVPVLANELGALAVDYPIVLTKNPETGQFVLFALVGLEAGENLFLDADGRWGEGYVPLDIQRGPFIAVRGKEEGQGAIGLDRDHPAIGEKDGAAIFAASEGGPALIEAVRPIVSKAMSGIAPTQKLIEILTEHDLLRAGQIEYSRRDEPRKVTGFYTVDVQAVARLSDAQLGALNRQGMLYALHLLAASLGNVRKLIVRV